MQEKIKPNRRAYIPLFFLMVIIVVSVVIGYMALEHKDKSFTNTHFAMGVQVHQMLYGNDAEFASQKVKERIEELEDNLSYDIDGSDVDRINGAAGEKWVKSSEDTIQAIDKFVSIASKNMGIIDPTALPLVSMWGFDSGIAKHPSKSDIEAALKNINYKYIKVNSDVSRVKIENKDTSITLKPIEKGMACAAAVEIYKSLKVDYGVVSVGGIVGVYGIKPDNSLWKISVRDPFVWNKEDTRIASIKVKDGFVATFGTKDDKIDINGNKKNKILNIKTGYPIENSIELVSVIHPDAIIANALSQMCCILEKEESLMLLNYYGAEAVFVYSDRSMYVTPNIKENFSIIDTTYTLGPS